MTPSRTLVRRLPVAMLEDVANLSNPDPPQNQLLPIGAPFTVDRNLTLADITISDALVATSIVQSAVATQLVNFDKANRKNVYSIWAPNGPLRFTSFAQEFPLLIYGYAIVGNAGLTLFAVEKFLEPLSFMEDDQDYVPPFPQMIFPDDMWR